MLGRVLAAALVSAGMTTAAQAEWQRAESTHYIEDAITAIKPLAYRMKPASELSPRERAQRNKERKTYAMVGEDPTSETARELLVRLQKKRPAASPTGFGPTDSAPAVQPKTAS